MYKHVKLWQISILLGVVGILLMSALILSNNNNWSRFLASVSSAGVNFDQETKDLLLAPSVFDVNYYRSQYLDLQQAGLSNSQLEDHWLNFGIREGRRGSEEFWSVIYLQRYPDVAAYAGALPEGYYEAIKHYAFQGREEGRNGKPSI